MCSCWIETRPRDSLCRPAIHVCRRVCIQLLDRKTAKRQPMQTCGSCYLCVVHAALQVGHYFRPCSHAKMLGGAKGKC